LGDERPATIFPAAIALNPNTRNSFIQNQSIRTKLMNDVHRPLVHRSTLAVCLAGGLALTGLNSAYADIPAFPGALGFGANATGGRTGTVYHVTTLADSGPGSFRDAVSSANRIVVFDVGGYISLGSAVSVKGNITIAGQTAPGGGIGFKGGEISFANRSNIICRYIRIRPGSETASTSDDALSLYRARNVICDHVSMEFGPWNNLDAVSDDWQNYPVSEVTFQNCLDADPTGQQFGAHTESVSSTMSWFGTIFANSHNRNPLSKINDVFVNNVVYNCQMGYTTHTSTGFSHDIVNNYFIAGPLYSSSTDFPWYQVDENQSIYYSGNLFDSDSDGTLNGSITTPYWYHTPGTILSAPWSSITTNIPVYDTASSYRIAVSQAGTLPRDAIDDLVISQVKTLGNGPAGTGAGTAGNLYTSQTETGLGNNGYGVINGGIPPVDSDGDGLPDYWELTVGLNPSSDDAMTIAADGYANLEHYLNWLADPHALTATNNGVDVDLWQFTSGFTNASPVYSVNNASNGVVALTNGHIARFTPATDYFGLGSFQFGVVAADGSGYTNTVTIAIVPQSQSQAQPSYLVWRGDGVTNLWAVGSGTNWFDGTNLVAFSAGDTVTFDDTGTNTPAINLSGALTAGTVYVLAEQDYTFGGSGKLGGTTGLFKTGSGQLNINTTNNNSGGLLINEGVVQVGDGVNYSGSIGGNITNNDTLIFNNPGTASSSASISGSGPLIKRGAGTLTVSGTQSYTNLTLIEAGTLEFSGTPPPGNITNNSVLTFKPSGALAYGGSISGPGRVTAGSSSITLTLSGVNTFSGGITVTTGNLLLANNSAAGTGPVTNTSSGLIYLGNGVVITNDFTLTTSTADLSMRCDSGTATWAGNVTVLGSASWRPGSDGGTLVFTGTANQGTHNFIVPRGSVQFATNAVVSAAGTATALGRDSTDGNRSANIYIRDNAALTLGACSIGGNKQGGSVTVTIQNNGSLFLGTSNLDLHYINRATAVSTLRLNGGTLTAGGFSKTKSSYANVINFNGGLLRAGANNASFLPGFTSQTANVQAGGAVIDDGGFAITIAAPLVHDSALGATADGGLTKLGAGTLTLSGANTFTGPTLINAGTLALTGSGSMANSTNIGVAAGAVFDVSNISGYALGSGSTLWGNGTVNGSLNLGSGAILSPGSNSIGALTFNNDLAVHDGAVLQYQLGADSNLTVVHGNLTLGGTLNVTSSGGLMATNYTLFTYDGSLSGHITLGATPTGYSWSINTNVTGKVMLVARPYVTIQYAPSSRTAYLGTTINFAAYATGSPPLYYLWFADGTNLVSCSTNSRLVLTNLQFSRIATYTVVVTNMLGAATSSAAMLNVIPPVDQSAVPAISVTGEAGSLLNVDYTSALSPTPGWNPLGSVVLTGTSQFYFDVTASLPPERFYRVWQAGTPAIRPSLNLSLVPAITLTGNIGDSLQLSCINQTGPTDAWVILDTVTLTNTSQLYLDVSGIGQPPRLYQIVPVP
jgi:autotransporter-associated beta strand protein